MVKGGQLPLAFAGAILAGGASRRMGVPKDALPFRDGRPMAAHVAAVVRSVCGRVVLVGGRRRLGDYGCDYFLPDESPGAGPLTAVATLLASGIADAYLVAPCDQPLLTPRLLRRLVEEREGPAVCFARRDATEPDPLPAFINASAAALARELVANGERSLRGFLAALPAAVILLNDGDAELLLNVNTPADWDRARRFRAARQITSRARLTSGGRM